MSGNAQSLKFIAAFAEVYNLMKLWLVSSTFFLHIFPPIHCFFSSVICFSLLFQISYSRVHGKWIEWLISLFMLYEKWNISRLFSSSRSSFALSGSLNHCFCLIASKWKASRIVAKIVFLTFKSFLFLLYKFMCIEFFEAAESEQARHTPS